jgi:hypothetical protein
MKKRLAKIIFAILLCAVLPTVSYGQLITISIEAVVTGVTDNDNLLEGKVTIGGTITGTYTYDTSTPDTNPISFIGGYSHSSSQCGVTLIIGELDFSTNTNDTNFRVTIVDNSPDIPGDGYSWHSYNNNDLDNDVQVDSIYWQIIDNTGTALYSTALPTTAPILSNWQYDNHLTITGGTGGIPPCYEKTFSIGAEVTSAVLIPEPMSLLFFGFGFLALRKPK